MALDQGACMHWVQAGTQLLLRLVQQGRVTHSEGSRGRCWRRESRKAESKGSSNGVECLKMRNCVWCKKLLNEELMHTVQRVSAKASKK